MSNPFAKTYEDLRRPYLEGKMAKKDYDGDGKIETGTQEYMGSKDKAIKKAMGKKVTKEHHQKDADGNVIPHGDGTPSSVEEEQINELSKKTLGGYVKKASKETRGNMVATQHGSGIPKKAKDIKLKQVNKRLKGIEKAGEKLAKEDVKMSRKEYSKIHKDFKSDDPKNPRTTKYVKGKGTVSMPVKFTDEYHYLEKHLELELDEAGTLGTLHVADMKANTKAWQNRMGVNKKGQRLYDFGQDLIQKLSYEYPDDMKMIEAKDTSAMKKYLDAKAKKLTKEKEAQKPEYKNNPAFGDPSHHSNRKNRKESFSDWRSDFIWEDGDSIKKT